MTFFILLIVVIGVLIYLPYFLESRRAPIDAAARKNAPGQFADLSKGATHYTWHGPARGPVLVAIHGLTTPSPVWDVIAVGLGAVGYRVLTYDLYGRGYSDAPEGEQDREFFLLQLLELLHDQGLNDEVTLLGYSMGGSIASAFAEENPDRVKRLFLLASAGIEVNESDFSKFCRTKPIIGDHVFKSAGAFRMAREVSEQPEQDAVPDIKDVQLAQLKRRGFLNAVLSSRRGILEEVQKEAHQEIGREDIPVIAIWGDEDDVIPLAALGTLAQWNRNARQETIKGAGHAIAYTHGEEVLDVLRNILIEQD